MNDKEEGSSDNNSGDLNDDLESARQGYFEFNNKRQS